jgi:hypothetical protein
MFSGGTRVGEIDRTAEMIVELARQGHIDRAIWLIHDSNRFDAPSIKLLAERVQAHVAKP